MKTNAIFMVVLAVIVLTFMYKDLLGKTVFTDAIKTKGIMAMIKVSEGMNEGALFPMLGSRVETSDGKSGVVIGYHAKGTPVIR